jgi:ATP-dependent Lon protease
MLESSKLRSSEIHDACYIHNIRNPDQPRLLRLPAGSARPFQRAVAEFVRFVQTDLVARLDDEHFRNRRQVLDAELESRTRTLVSPLEEKLAAKDLALVTLRVGDTAQPGILPVVEGNPVSAERFQELVHEGTIPQDAPKTVSENIQSFRPALEEISTEIDRLHEEHHEKVRQLVQTEVRALVAQRALRIARQFSDPEAVAFLDAMVEDVTENRLGALANDEGEALSRLYGVNVVVSHESGAKCPVLAETNPTVENLVGRIDPEFHSDGSPVVDHNCIRAGAFLRADGGYLLIEARELLQEEGGWKALMRTLRSGSVDLMRPDQSSPSFAGLVKPEAAPVNVKLVLVGDPGIYHALEAVDPDFSTQFKALVDFDSTLPASAETVGLYARVFAKIVKEEELLPITADGIAALAEHGARIAERSDRLTTRFGRLADIAREGNFLAQERGNAVVDAGSIRQAILDMKRRADLPARHFRRAIADGSIRIETRGMVVGQVNGLAVVHTGPLTYGFPARITATIGAGSAGTINIEREAQLSGAIHTKGFYILGGLLRHLLRTPHPLAFSASVAFEQSYGGIDGDSASGAEMCCLLSALTQLPLRQDLAMTGSIDQLGHVQIIGAVNEKIEGFFDACRDLGLTGTQGVIIPRANANDLMLRRDVVQACAEGKFWIYAVESIHEALEIFTGLEAGRHDDAGKYPEGTLLHRAVDRAAEFWKHASHGRG